MSAPAHRDDLGQPIGPPVAGWTPRPAPARKPMEGRSCRVEPLDPERHLEDLWRAVREDTSGRLWTYLSYGPFASVDLYRRWLLATCTDDDPLFFAIVERDGGRALGLASYLRIEPLVGVLEIGHLQFSPRLQRTLAASEAMFLMLRRAFRELGYRRCEWKTDSLNARSRRAAERLGFRFEGVFRQATLYKGRSRDTAWYSILDHEWPGLEPGFRAWLADENFDDAGVQRAPLRALLERSRASSPPAWRGATGSLR